MLDACKLKVLFWHFNVTLIERKGIIPEIDHMTNGHVQVPLSMLLTHYELPHLNLSSVP